MSAVGPTASIEPSPSLPPLGRRLAVGGVRFLLAGVALVAVPLEVVRVLSTHHVSTSIASFTIVGAGLALAALGAARSVLRPTAAYGPTSMLASAAATAYLWILSSAAQASVTVGGHVALTIGFGEVMRLIALAPAIGFVAAAVTTWEDLAHPGERLRAEYPPRSAVSG